MTSALFLTVPDAEPLLDVVRGLPGVGLLEPAHITIAYPWVPDPSVERVLAAARAVPAGTIELRGPELFEQDVRRRTVIHAILSDDSLPHALAAALGVSIKTPHLSIARVRHDGSVPDVLAALTGLLPLTVRLDTLELTHRTDQGWEALTRAPLG